MNQLDIAIIILGGLTTMQTAWLHYQTNKNACGGIKCQQNMIEAFKLSTARLNGLVTHQDRQDARWHSPES